MRLQDSPLDVDPAGERDRASVSLQSSGDFLERYNKNKINLSSKLHLLPT